MKMRHLVLLLLAAAVALLFLLPVAAFAAATSDAPPLPRTELLSSTQFWAAVFGSVVPAASYLLNHYAPWVSEQAKGLFLLLLSAAVGAVAQLLDAGSLAFDTNTLQVIGTAVATAFISHQTFWKPTGISFSLKAGTNHRRSAPPAP